MKLTSHMGRHGNGGMYPAAINPVNVLILISDMTSPQAIAWLLTATDRGGSLDF